MSETTRILEKLLFQIEEVASKSCGRYFELFKPHLLLELFEFRNQLSQDEATLFTALAREHGYDMSDTRLINIATEECRAFNTILVRET